MSRSATAPAPQRIPRRPLPGVGAPGVATPEVPSRHLRLVDPDARRRERRRRWLVRVWAVGIVAAALLGVTVHAFMAEVQMRLGRVEHQTKVEQARYEEARLRVARLDAPAAIFARALELGLVPAATTRIVAATSLRGSASATSSNATKEWQDTKPALGSNP